MKQKSTKPKSLALPHIQRSVIFVYLLVVVLMLAVAALAITLKVVRDDAARADRHVFRQNTIQSLTSFYAPSVVDPAAQKQYIYEMGVRFPIEMDRIQYDYQPEFKGDSPAYAEISTPSLLSIASSVLQKDTLEEVTKASFEYSECIKPFVISYVSDFTFYGDYEQVGQVPLANGRTLFVFKEQSCKVLHSTKLLREEVQALEQRLLQAESY